MQELALVIENPVEGQWLKHIDWNKAEFEKAIEEAVRDYQDVAYGEDQIKQAKDDRAALNKIKKAIEDRRKAVKKVVNAPYDQFEKEVKEVTQKLDAAVTQIDTQVKAYEARQKEEKKALILDYFRETLVRENHGDIDAERLCDTSWLNASVSMAQIRKAIETRVENLKNGFAFCDNLPDDERTIALMTFEKGYDIGAAIAEVNAYRQKKAAEEAAKEEARKHEEIQKRLEKITGEEHEEKISGTDALVDALSECVGVDSVLEAQGKADGAEDHSGVKTVKTISIPFNGTNLSYILGAIQGASLPKRGIIKISFQGTDEQIAETLEEIRKHDVRYKEEP